MGITLVELDLRVQRVQRALNALYNHRHTDGSEWELEDYVKSTRLISSSEGITGGGDLSADRTLVLDIPGLDADGSPDSAADYVAIYDASGTVHKKVLLNNLPGGTDSDAIHDNVAGEIVAVTEKTAPVGNDEMLIEDSAASNAKKSLKLSNLDDLFLLLAGGTMAGDLTFAGDDIVMGAGDTVDGVDLSANFSCYFKPNLRSDITMCVGAAAFSAVTNITVALPFTYAGVGNFGVFPTKLATGTGAPYMAGGEVVSTSSIKIWMTASYTGNVYYITIGF